MLRTLYYKYNLFLWILVFFFYNITLFPQSLAKEYFEKAKNAYESFAYFEATGFLQKALKENPFYIEAQLLLGDSYFKMGNFNASWEIYLAAEKKQPNNAEILLRLARTKLKLAQSRDELLATEYYLKKAYAISPRNSSITTVYGEFFLKLGNYAKAMEYYNNLGENLSDPQIYINKAEIYSLWGEEEKALDSLIKAEQLDSKNFQVLLSLGKLYNKMNKPKEALTFLNAAYSYNPKDQEVLQALSDLYIKEKDFADASYKISQLILNDTSNPILYYNLALCYEALGDFQKAVEVLKEGLKYDYSNEFLRIKAEEITISKLPLSSKEREEFAEFYNIQAKNLIKKNKDNQAFFPLKRSLRIAPLDINIRIKLADLYRKKSFLYEYLNLLQGGLFLSPQDTFLQDQFKLNQKFIINSLENKEKLNPKPFLSIEPIIKISSARIENDQYQYFVQESKELLLENLLNFHSLNAFIQEEGAPRGAQFEIKFTLTPSPDKIRAQVEVIYISTGSVYLSYDIVEYGNNKLLNIMQRISKLIEKDIPKIGRILKIDGNTAIINLGAQQGMKIGKTLSILNDPSLPDKFFTVKAIDPNSEIATGKVIELGENMSKISFKPLDRVIFNMVQQNQSIIISQQES